MTSKFQQRLEWLNVWGGGTLMGMLAADVVIGSYNAGVSPFKPSLFTPLVFVFCVTVGLLSRPRFCLAALLLLALPVYRLLDVAILARHNVTGLDSMAMSCARLLLVQISMIAVLSAPSGLRAMRWAAILTILLTSGSSIAEFLNLVKFSSIPGRFSGFNGHPNSPPIVICQCLGLCFALVKNFRWNMAIIAAGIPGVALTYGRSGMVIFAFVVGIYILMNARRNLGFLIMCTYIIVPVMGLGFTLMQQRTTKGIQQDKNTADRLEAIYSLDFEKLKSPERAKDLSDAWEAVIAKPVFGHGVGAASYPWAPHNEYVAMWLELGAPGLLVYLATLYIPVLRSLTTGGRAAYALLAMLLYSPIAQGRVMDPHFYLTLLTSAYILWPGRFMFTLRNPPQAVSDIGHRPQLPGSQSSVTLPFQPQVLPPGRQTGGYSHPER